MTCVKTSPTAQSCFFAAGDVEIDGYKVTVGLGQDNPRAEAGLFAAVTYERPADSAAAALRDLAGNPVRTPYRDPYTGWLNTRVIGLDDATGAPSVTRVAVSSDAGADRTYARGETIRVTLTFNEAVNVTGAPRVKLDFSSGAGDERWAAYASGSGTNVLEFAYTVAEGDALDRRRGGAREHAGVERRHAPLCVGR